MSDLERRAMLGDQQAQEECSRQGIALPCPLCGKQVRRSVSGMLFYCSECHCNTSFHSDAVSKEEALSLWNRRPAPAFRVGDRAWKANDAYVFEVDVRRLIYDCGRTSFDGDDIGETVFRTKDEAEAAMVKMKEVSDHG